MIPKIFFPLAPIKMRRLVKIPTQKNNVSYFFLGIFYHVTYSLITH